MMQLSQVSTAVQGQMLGGDVSLAGVCIDSRQDCSDELFIALRGDRFDAHDYLQQAQQHGAAAAIVERQLEVAVPTVLVDDSHQALKDLAAWWRSQFSVPVIGLTGSVGKTTVKEMLRAIFAQVGKGLVTEGNLNNEIGVPLTLLRFEDSDQYAIIEMGMNHAGEISRLSHITKPTIALINNAAAAHLEGLGTVAAVANAKAEIFDGLTADGIAIINADDEFAANWLDLLEGRRVITFGLNSNADISAHYELQQSSIRMQIELPENSLALDLPLIGKHSVMNVLAAVAVSYAADISRADITQGLANYQPIKGRMNIVEAGELTVIDDSYNANPASMRAAIEVLAQFSPSCLIVGDMAELGAASEREHLNLGEVAQSQGIDQMFACGEYAELSVAQFNGEKRAFKTQPELLSYLQANAIESGAVLVKGSRSAKMEKVIEVLLAATPEQGGDC